MKVGLWDYIKAAFNARPLGMFVAAGPHVAAGSGDELSLLDVCPLALALLEQPVPEGLDGALPSDVLHPSFRSKHPIRMAGPTAERVGAEEYSDAEATAVASHLKDLGYIE